MKILLVIVCLVISAATALAQIPNFSFENWTTVGGYITPDNWDNLNPTTSGAGVYTCTKGTPGNPGASFIKLTSRTVSGVGVVPGIAVCGVLDQATRTPVSGFAFSQRPLLFTGKWQYMAYGIKPGFMDVTLTRWDASSGSRVVVASLHKILTGMVMSWGNFSVPLDYQDGQSPDTCLIFLSASGSSATNNDYLWLDNLQFEGVVTAIESIATSKNDLTLYPNPARDFFTISFDSPANGTATFQIIDLHGSVIGVKKAGMVCGKNKTTFDVKDVPPGVYIVKISSGSFENSARMIVN